MRARKHPLPPPDQPPLWSEILAGLLFVVLIAVTFVGLSLLAA